MNEMHWRSVKEELPTVDGLVLVFAPSADDRKPLIGTAWYDPSGRGWSLMSRVWIDAITHWMPMPEGPSE